MSSGIRSFGSIVPPRVGSSAQPVVEFASLLAARADVDHPEGTLAVVPTGNLRLVSGVWVPEFVYRMGSPVTVGTLSGKVLPSAEGWTHVETGPSNITTDGTHVRLLSTTPTEQAFVSMEHTETGFGWSWVDGMFRLVSVTATAPLHSQVTLYDGDNMVVFGAPNGRWAPYTNLSDTGADTGPHGCEANVNDRPDLSVEGRLTIIAKAGAVKDQQLAFWNGMLVSAALYRNGSGTPLKKIGIGDESFTSGQIDWRLRSLAWGVA